jgi:DNA-binding LacI/PurR family transcriptional regulator
MLRCPVMLPERSALDCSFVEISLQKLSRTTIVDIAKASGVSVSTVSRILNDKPDVAETTRKRVLEEIEARGYTRQAQWQQLAAGKSHVISIHYPRRLEGFNYASMDFITGATAACEEQHYALNLITKPLDRNQLLGLYDSMRTDAMILMEILATDWRVELLRTHQLPFVMIGRCNDNTGRSYVDIDFEGAVSTSVDHLVALGHRQIGFLAAAPNGAQHDYSPALRSLERYRAMCSRYGLPTIFRETNLELTTIREAIRSLLTEQPQITALITMDGTASVRLVQAVQSLNLAIPGDVSVIGTVASEVAELTTPPLTTINPLGYAIGYEAGKMLIEHLEGRVSDTNQVLMPVLLIVRGSTGPVRRDEREQIEQSKQ